MRVRLWCVSQIHFWMKIYQKLYGFQLTISMIVKSRLAHKVMACGKVMRGFATLQKVLPLKGS